MLRYLVQWYENIACGNSPRELRQAVDSSTHVNFSSFSRLTGPEKYHLMRCTLKKKQKTFNLINYSNITVCTATRVNIVIKNSFE